MESRWPIKVSEPLKNTVILFASRLIFKKLELAGVKVFRIKDIAKTTSGGTPSRNIPEYFEGDIPWLKSGELNDDFIFDAEENITEEALKNSSAKIFPKGTLLVALYGATVGKTGILGINAATNQAICAIFPKEGVERDYLYWYFRMKRQDFLISSYGGAQPNISQKTIKEALIPIPSIELQKKVIDFLNSLSSGFADLNDIKMLEPLSDIPRKVARIGSLMTRIEEARQLRVEAVREAEELLKESQKKVFFSLFQNWPTERLGNLVKISSGVNLTSSQMKDSGKYFVYGGGGIAGRYNQYMFEDKMIGIGRVGARCGCVFITKPKSWITDNALYIKQFSNTLDFYYLAKSLDNLDLRQQAKQSAQPVVSQKRIKSQKIPLPPLPVQRRIVAYLDSLQAKVDELKKLQEETGKEMEELIPSILDKAFEGEL